MRLHRFYVEEKLGVGRDFVLENENQIHQILKVFRLGAGDKAVLFDGSGFDFVSAIKSADKEKVIFEINEKKEGILPAKKINLFLATIRKERFEWAVEKATELGVASITPIITERGEHTHLNIERLKKIAVEASEQCGRADLPKVNQAVSLELLASSLDSNTYVADMDGDQVSSLQLKANSCKLFIGPEGGWSDSEREFFRNHNAKFISLGETTLRAETAAIVAICSI